MRDEIWISCIATLCVVFGFAKNFFSQFFLKLRNRYSLFNVFNIYSFIFKSTYADQAVRINGYILLVIGLGLFSWVVYN